MSTHRLLLVDGSSYLYRAFHAMPDLRNAQGFPTGAIQGMVNMMRRARTELDADHIDCIFDAKGKPVIDKKTKEPKVIPNPEWLLFEKCMRGDSSDNVFSAFPGVRVKGTKNKVGLTEAFEDRSKQGYAWNNIMLQRWTDPDGAEHRVLDDYERNRMLIDLTAQPVEIKQAVDNSICSMISHKDIGQVGIRFMKFCGKYELTKASESAEQYARWLNETYKGVLDDRS